MRLMGDYIVGDTLGEGGFSFVKLGVHKTTKERVALKMLRKDKLNLSSTVKKQVEREIVAMEKIQHKNVIRLKHVDWDAKYEKKNGTKIDVILVVLELANGGELFEFLSFTGCFEEAVARTYFLQLIEGVAYCHSKGVVHRDLKPENLLLDENFVLKLADFGFSNVFSLSGQSNTMFTECGTPGYMAPEMFTGKGYDAVAADIWACGVILFIMLAGFPPFQKPHVSDWWFNKLSTNKHNLFWQAHCRSAQFSDSSKDLINKILNPDPTKRITIADMKKHSWFSGTTISDSGLVSEFSRRKVDVDEAKVRQREEKMRQQMQNQNREQLADGVNRSIDDLPSTVPSFSSHKKGEFTDTETFDLSSFDSNPFASLSFDQKVVTVPEMFDPLTNTACYTRFESTVEASKLIKKIENVFKSFGAKYEMDGNRYFIKSNVITSVGPVILTSQIFSHPSDKGKYVVEFRRRQGDSLQYRSIYSDIRSQLENVILVNKKDNTQTVAN